MNCCCCCLYMYIIFWRSRVLRWHHIILFNPYEYIRAQTYVCIHNFISQHLSFHPVWPLFSSSFFYIFDDILKPTDSSCCSAAAATRSFLLMKNLTVFQKKFVLCQQRLLLFIYFYLFICACVLSLHIPLPPCLPALSGSLSAHFDVFVVVFVGVIAGRLFGDGGGDDVAVVAWFRVYVSMDIWQHKCACALLKYTYLFYGP